jgi:hypothetical protein
MDLMAIHMDQIKIMGILMVLVEVRAHHMGIVMVMDMDTVVPVPVDMDTRAVLRVNNKPSLPTTLTWKVRMFDDFILRMLSF